MAFGDNSFGGDNSSSVGRRGRGNRGGNSIGGGNNRNRNRNRNKNKNPSITDPPASTAGGPFAPSSGDPFDDVTTDLGGSFGGSGSVLEDPDTAGAAENWREFSTGLLNQGGIFNDRAFGSQQGDWLDNQMQDWYDQWQGQGQLAGSDAETYDQFLYGLPGTQAPASGAVTQDWLANTWGPAMQQYLTARYQSQTPRQRGTQVSAWTGPRRVIQFLFLAASAGAIIAEFASKAIGA